MTEVMAVVADETIAPVVEGVAELPQTADGLVLVAERVEAEVAAAQVHRLGLRVAGPRHLAAAQTVGAVNPTVQAEDRVTDAQLRILGGETLVQDLAFIAFAGALRVA